MMRFSVLQISPLYAVIAAAAAAHGLCAQIVPEPSHQMLDSAPAELRIGGVQVRFKSELRVLSIMDQPARGVQLDGSITLFIIDANGIPNAVHADRAWLRNGDSIAAGSP